VRSKSIGESGAGEGELRDCACRYWLCDGLGASPFNRSCHRDKMSGHLARECARVRVRERMEGGWTVKYWRMRAEKQLQQLQSLGDENLDGAVRIGVK
jgi:hypothetical protein